MSKGLVYSLIRAGSYFKGVYHLVGKGVCLKDAMEFSYSLARSNIRDAFASPVITYSLYEESVEHGSLEKAASNIHKLREARLFDPHKKDHISLTDSIGSVPQDRGKLFTSEKDGSNIRVATEQEIREANLFAIGGIDFDNKKYLSALLKSVYKLQSLTLDPHPLWYCKPLALHPYVSKEDRYHAAVQYNLDKKYFPEYASCFIENIIIPRIVNTADGSIKAPERDITFFSYSVGGRDILMFENALRDGLRKRGATQDKIYEVFAKIKGVSLAFAVDIEGLEHDVHFLKVILFFASDLGVLIPIKTKELIESIEFASKPHIHVVGKEEKLIHKQFLAILTDADNLFPYMEDRYLGHGLNSYLKAIAKSDELKELFCLPLHAVEYEKDLVQIGATSDICNDDQLMVY